VTPTHRIGRGGGTSSRLHGSSLPRLDTVIAGGRVIDPASGLDAIRDIGIRDGEIVAIGTGLTGAAHVIDAAGLVVAAGFVDLHSHALDPTGMTFQALDGVTTALELEGGTLAFADTVAWMSKHGRRLNFGMSASWAAARMSVLAQTPPLRPWEVDGYRCPLDARRSETHLGDERLPSAAQQAGIEALLAAELDAGAIGIGVLLGYVPWAGRHEIDGIFTLAAYRRVPLFVHSRSLSLDGGAVRAVRELLDTADRTGAHVHLCHLNSTSGTAIQEVVAAIAEAQESGVRVTTEAYPYGAGSTAIGSEFLAPERLADGGLTPQAITVVSTGERIDSVARLAELRAADPTATCLVRFLDEDAPTDRLLLEAAFALAGTAVASDSGLAEYAGTQRGRAEADHAVATDAWPLPPGFASHPRSAGAFTRALSWLTSGSLRLSLSEALARCSLEPARILEHAVPAMRRKGRIAIGADADLVVLDLATLQDHATYGALAPSSGIVHSLVGGVPVVLDRNPVPGARAGRPVLTRALAPT
jgi:hypothetical protein